MILSVRQQRALQVMRHLDREEPRWIRSGQWGLRTNTLESLCQHGFAEARTVFPTLDRHYRITRAGIEQADRY